MLTVKDKFAIAGVLKSQDDIAAAYLFGSQNRENADENSDIDLGIVFVGGKDSLKRELELEHQISQAVGRKIDVRSLNLLQSPVFLMQAAQGELLIGHDRQERVAFETELDKLNDDAQQYFRIARHYV